MKKRGKKAAVESGIALKNAGVCGEKTGDFNAALQAYKAWVDVESIPVAYQNYLLALKKAGRAEEVKKVLDEGLAKFPKDGPLLLEKVNSFLPRKDYTSALVYVNRLLAEDPGNDHALFVKALAYEKLQNTDSVIYYYKKTVAANPKNENAAINLAAAIISKAGTITQNMNTLGKSAEDNRTYSALKLQAHDLYASAKTYLQQVLEINPKNADAAKTLMQIDAYLGTKSGDSK